MGCHQKLVNLVKNNKKCTAIVVFLACTSIVIAGSILLIVSAIPRFDAQTKEITFGDVFNDHSTSVITLDDAVSSIQLNLIQQVHPNSKVNISISSIKPSMDFLTGQQNFEQIFAHTSGMLTSLRTSCNYLEFDEPIYLLPGSTLKYQLSTANLTNIRLCIFNDSLVYAHFLSDYSYEYTSCFNTSNNGSITFNITQPSSYYVAIEVPNNIDILRESISVIRFYYNVSNMKLSNECPHSLSADNPFCELTICNTTEYFCHWLKKKYLILQSAGTVTLKYTTYETFLVKLTVWLHYLLFLVTSTIILISTVIAILAIIAREWNNSDVAIESHQSPNTRININSGSDDEKSPLINSSKKTRNMKNFTVRGCILCTSLSIILGTFCAVVLIVASLINSSQPRPVIKTDIIVGIGNKRPVLLDPNGFKATYVTVTWKFPRAEAIAVYKTPCNKLTTSSAVLPVHYIPHLNITCTNPRNGFNYNQYSIPLNLAKGSNVTYNITVTSSSKSKACSPSSGIECFQLLLMNTQDAYNEFLALPRTSKFTNYISHSQCLDLQNNSSFTFQINHVQNDYYVGIESPNDITVNAAVSGVQVYYDTSNLDNVCPDLSISNPSCTVSICPNRMCSKYDEHICILVNSSSPDEVSYHSSLAILTGTSVYLFYAAVVSFCGSSVIAISTLVCYCVTILTERCRKKDHRAEHRKDLVNNSVWKHKKKYCCFACGVAIATCTLAILVLSAAVLGLKSWKFHGGSQTLLRAKDYVSLHHQNVSQLWFAVSDIYVSIQNESSDLDIDLYSIPCSEVTIYHHNISHSTTCNDWSGPCKLHEYLYIVRTENVSLNFSITLTSKVKDLQFRVSVFDDDKTYENFLSTDQYQPLKTVVFNESIAKPFLFNLSYTEMRQPAAYYHIVIHPSVPSQYLQQEANHSQIEVQHSGVISYYNLTNFTPVASLSINETFTLKHPIGCIFAYCQYDSSNTPDNSTHVLLYSQSSIHSTSNMFMAICIPLALLFALIALIVIPVLVVAGAGKYRQSTKIFMQTLLKRQRIISNDKAEYTSAQPANRSTSCNEHQSEIVAPMPSYQPKLLMNEQTMEILSRIFGELTVLTVDSSGLTHRCNQYDVTLIIPEGAVQQSATVWIGACLFSDKFHFEGDYVPVTPIVWVYIDCELVKEAELYLSHYIDTTSSDDVANDFVILAADDESITRQEKMCFRRSTDYFLQDSWKGCTTLNVSAKHFCSLCGAENREKHKVSKKKFLMMKAEKREGNDIVYVDICLLYLTCRKIVEIHNEKQGYVLEIVNHPFEFQENPGRVSLSFSPETVQNWKRSYMSGHKYISEGQIDYVEIWEANAGMLLEQFEKELSYPPRFRLKFKKIHRAGLSDDGDIAIKLDGTKDELNISIELECADIENAQPSRPNGHDPANLIDVHTMKHQSEVEKHQEMSKIKPRRNNVGSSGLESPVVQTKSPVTTPVPVSMSKDISTSNSELADVATCTYTHELPFKETGTGIEYHTATEASRTERELVHSAVTRSTCSTSSPADAFVSGTSTTNTPTADIAYDVLRTNTSCIKESGISLTYLADKLADTKIISEDDKKEAITDMMSGLPEDRRMDKLLGTLKATVKRDGATFGTFIQILRTHGTKLYDALANELMTQYEQRLQLVKQK